nr:uncharacterized protein LOC122271344 [Parasteatoda tepidariorum]
MYDETTNSANKQELQTVVRYWSDAQNCVISQHLKTMFIGSATAKNIFKKLTEAMDEMKLPLGKLLMLGSDGPNVNKKVHRLMNEEVKLISDRELVDIGTCNIHIVHNAFLKGLNELGENAADLITSVYHFFDGWPSRWDNFVIIQEKEGVPHNKMIKHCSSRWLTLELACTRMIEQWQAINIYFLMYIPQSKSSLGNTNRHCKNVMTLLKKSTIKAELHFALSSAHIFTSFTGVFQKEEPLVHVLYDELSTLIQTLNSWFCKKSFLEQNIINTNSVTCETNHLPLKQVVCCGAVMAEIKSLSDSEKYNFLKAA